MQQFPFLVHSAGRDKDKCLWSHYSPESLGPRSIVARVGRSRVYCVADNITAAAECIEKDAEQIYHEVIPGKMPQRLKFDIDADAALMARLNLGEDFVDAPIAQRGQELLKYMIVVIQSCFDKSFAENLSRAEPPTFLVFSSSSDEKISYHIIIAGYYAENNQQAIAFTKFVVDVIAGEHPGVEKVIDAGVNSDNQNFRLMNQYKLKNENGVWVQKPTKRFIGEYRDENTIIDRRPITLAESFIRNIDGCQLLPTLATMTPAEPEVVSVDYEQIRDICESVKELREHHRFRGKVRGKPIYGFDSLRTQTVCTVCPIGGDRNVAMNYGRPLGIPGGLARVLTPEETHAKDNFYFVRTATTFIDDSHYRIDVFLHCRNAGGPGVKIGSKEIVAISEEDKEECRAAHGKQREAEVEKKILPMRERILQNIVESPRLQLRNPLLAECGRTNVYTEPQLRPFELASTLVVKAAMKMGKTKQLIKYINEHFSSADSVIRVISFRQTFSASILASLRQIGFQSYQDFAGPITNDNLRIVVQVESMHRIQFRPHDTTRADLVILDECESIIGQLGSPNHGGNYSKNMAIFKELISHGHHVVCMDAYAGRRTLEFLKELRPTISAQHVAKVTSPIAQKPVVVPGSIIGKDGQIDDIDVPGELAGMEFSVIPGGVFHYNDYKNQVGDNYFVTADEGRWLTLIHRSIDMDEKIVICTNSKTRAKHIYRVMLNKLGQDHSRIKIYSSESTSVDRLDFDDVATKWRALDVLIYTPTITAGISFELKHFDKMFCYFSDQSCDAATCMQMMGRVRNIVSAEYHICISALGDNLPTNFDDIFRAWHLESIRGMSYKWHDNLIDWEIAPDGTFTPVEGANVRIWAFNKAAENYSRNNFAKLLITLIAEFGSEVSYLDDDTFKQLADFASDEKPEKIIKDVVSSHKSANTEITNEEIQEIVEAPDIDDKEARVIEEKIINQRDLTRDEKSRWDRRTIRVTFDYWPRYRTDCDCRCIANCRAKCDCECDCEDEIIGGEITPRFVKTYFNKKTRRIFKNLQRLAVPAKLVKGQFHSPIKVALENIQEIDRERYRTIMRDDPDSLIGYRFVFQQHRFALHIARTIGITNIFSEQVFDQAHMFGNLSTAVEDIRWNWGQVSGDISIRTRRNMWETLLTNRNNRAEFLQPMIEFCNKVLGIMYGGKLVSSSAGEGDDGQPIIEPVYIYKPCNLFEIRHQKEEGHVTDRPIIWIDNE